MYQISKSVWDLDHVLISRNVELILEIKFDTMKIAGFVLR